MIRIRTLSTQPPANPATAPISVPSTIAKPTVRKPIGSDTRAPKMTRLNSSRRFESRPMTCCGTVDGAAEQVDARRRAALARLAKVEHRRVGVERGDERGEDRDQEQGDQDRQADHAPTLANDIAQRVPGERCRPGRRHGIGGTRCQGLGAAGVEAHDRRIRGSRNAYDMSTIRLTTR